MSANTNNVPIENLNQKAFIRTVHNSELWLFGDVYSHEALAEYHKQRVVIEHFIDHIIVWDFYEKQEPYGRQKYKRVVTNKICEIYRK